MDRLTVMGCLEELAQDDCWEQWYSDSEVQETAKAALSLLKEQEPQLVLNIGEQISCKSGSCPKCGKMLNTTCNKRYCGDCGQAVKWE